MWRLLWKREQFFKSEEKGSAYYTRSASTWVHIKDSMFLSAWIWVSLKYSPWFWNVFVHGPDLLSSPLPSPPLLSSPLPPSPHLSSPLLSSPLLSPPLLSPSSPHLSSPLVSSSLFPSPLPSTLHLPSPNTLYKQDWAPGHDFIVRCVNVLFKWRLFDSFKRRLSFSCACWLGSDTLWWHAVSLFPSCSMAHLVCLADI